MRAVWSSVGRWLGLRRRAETPPPAPTPPVADPPPPSEPEPDDLDDAPLTILDEALRLMGRLRPDSDRATLRIGLARLLPEADRTTLMCAALDDIGSEVGDRQGWTQYLDWEDLAAVLPPALRPQVADLVRCLDPVLLPDALLGLGAAIPQAERDAIGATLRPGLNLHRLRFHLALPGPEPARSEALRTILAEVLATDTASPWTTPREQDSAGLLLELARHLPDPEREAALREAMPAFRSPDSIASAIRVHPSPSAAFLEHLLGVARGLPDRYHGRHWALVGLLPHLSGVAREAVLQAALASAHGFAEGRASALADLAPFLPADSQAALLADRLAAARATGDPYSRANALLGCLPELAGEARARVLREATDATWLIHDEFGGNWGRFFTLDLLLAAHPDPAPVVVEGLGLARHEAMPYRRGYCLLALLPHAPPGERGGILHEALAALRLCKAGPSPGLVELFTKACEHALALAR